MAKREIKRNGRGQIISYEIESTNNSTTSSLQYGEVILGTPGVGIAVEKYEVSSFSLNVDTRVMELGDEILESYIPPYSLITLGSTGRLIELDIPASFSGSIFGVNTTVNNTGTVSTTSGGSGDGSFSSGVKGGV